MSVDQKDGRKVVLVMSKSRESDATLDVIAADFPELSVDDHGSYWSIEGLDNITIDLVRVAEELGEPISMPKFLISMTSYIGRAQPDDRYFIVTSDMLQMERT